MLYQPATQPTLYFIGVTTGQSSIMRVFPAWARHLGLKDAIIKGIDFPLHAEPGAYRAAVAFIKADPLSLGALVTTHKIDLFKACRDLFDSVDPHADLMDETSCLSKHDGKLVCHAKDPISSGLALDGFLPPDHFAITGAEAFLIGAGGSAIALTWHLMRRERGPNAPSRIIVSDRSQSRLDEIRRIHGSIASDVPVDYLRVGTPSDNDAVLNTLRPGALIINATGLGKDAPGSPLASLVKFPRNGIVWDLNYRGELIFLRQARAQKDAQTLQIEDGWTYFIHGWTQVIAEVFHIAIPTTGPGFEALSQIAIEASKP
ncbi:shikimate dehydrogenase family protein [Lichenifustis flavocetrariae]|uniref:Shikimate dehydrogenase n=1 Tax=Lichenifustis flavocetrariae TaxID=2949735 RepID=A0AA41YXB1_9HYPH|nr:shikimate dehydrogenase [Lichenifustis flavocetrariae]MCW6508887.1 shikimate dehydrogenase [Lichenifustis flavocetrariae]